MLRFTGLFLLLLSFLFFTFPTEGQEKKKREKEESKKKFASPVYGCSLEFPSSWKVQKGSDFTALRAFSPFEDKGDSFRENLIVKVKPLPPDLSLESFIDRAVATYARSLETWKLLESKGVKIHKYEGKVLLSRVEIRKNHYRLHQYFLSHNQQVWILTSMARKKAFGRYKKVFREIVETFRLSGPSPLFESPELHFQVRFPSEWFQQRGKKTSPIRALSPLKSIYQSHRASAHVEIENLSKGFTLDRYWKKALTQLGKEKALRVLSKGKTTLGGKKARKVKALIYKGSEEILIIQYIALYKNRAYLLNLVCPKEKHSQWKEKFNKIVDSFQWIKEK